MVVRCAVGAGSTSTIGWRCFDEGPIGYDKDGEQGRLDADSRPTREGRRLEGAFRWLEARNIRQVRPIGRLSQSSVLVDCPMKARDDVYDIALKKMIC